ncbi:hypothetical protein TNCV_4516241 [Trichonephila clavipes]|nr:hypothetical protein TNCV_4516241 [Trichonephila clavipes]
MLLIEKIKKTQLIERRRGRLVASSEPAREAIQSGDSRRDFWTTRATCGHALSLLKHGNGQALKVRGRTTGSNTWRCCAGCLKYRQCVLEECDSDIQYHPYHHTRRRTSAAVQLFSILSARCLGTRIRPSWCCRQMRDSSVKTTHSILPPTSFFHHTIGGRDICGSASRVDQPVDFLRTDHSAINGVEWYAQTLNDALQTQFAVLRFVM